MVDATDPTGSSLLWTPLRSRRRWLVATAAFVAAAAHIPVIGPHLSEAPYMGEEFIVLTVACLLLGVAAIACDSPAVYGLTAITCGLAVVGYIATRLVAFPQLADDVGNWLEILGIISVVSETVAVTAAISALRPLSRSRENALEGLRWIPYRGTVSSSTLGKGNVGRVQQPQRGYREASAAH